MVRVRFGNPVWSDAARLVAFVCGCSFKSVILIVATPYPQPTAAYKKKTAALRLQSKEQLRDAVDECIEIFRSGDCPEGPYGSIGGWDVSGVTKMAGIFSDASAFDQDLSKWDVSAVTDMGYMFHSASAFNHDLSTWDVSAVTNMRWMFYNAQSFNQNLSKWDVSTVTHMAYMFHRALAFNRELCGVAWVNSKADKEHMFADSTGSISSKVCTTAKPGYG